MSPGLRLFAYVSCCLAFTACSRGCSTSKNNHVEAVLNADRRFNFPPGFPPDPGAAGKGTLGGIDSDHDGLRDDIQRWIYSRYPNDEKKRKALRQMALDLQRDATLEYRREDAAKIFLATDRAVTCLMKTFPNDTDSDVELDYLRAKVLNTPARIRRADHNDAQLDGLSPGQEGTSYGVTCDE